MLFELMPLWMFLAVCVVLLSGFPVAFCLAGVALIAASLGIVHGHFDSGFIIALPERLFGILNNITLSAVPLFILMGVLLEKSKIADSLLADMASVFAKVPGGMAISVVLVGTLLAASTGIVGATVVTMGLISLPAMLKHGYQPSLAAGTICATGTLGQIIPPSIALVLLGDILSSAYQQAQISQGIFDPQTVSVGDLFVGALIPGMILVLLYCAYILIVALRNPESVPAVDLAPPPLKKLIPNLLAPLGLIFIVLGSIMSGSATPTEAAGVGAFGAFVLAIYRGQLSLTQLKASLQQTLEITAMVFMILFGAAVFSLVFRGFGGDELVQSFFALLPGGSLSAVILVMLVMFLLGFILDFIEIIFIVVPIVGPILLAMGIDPVWLGIMIAINLQTSFLTPPFGFALFYLRGVAPESLPTSAIYKGVIPFILIQVFVLVLLGLFPELVTVW